MVIESTMNDSSCSQVAGSASLKSKKLKNRKKNKLQKKLNAASAITSDIKNPRIPANSIQNTESSGHQWEFAAEYNDHFETPLVAYEDIAPVLTIIAKRLGKSVCDLIIYDPYYCKGNMVNRLSSIGFSTVINKNRDFYGDIASRNIPAYDILVTNPPYSGEHKLRLLNFLRVQQRPFALLLPAYTATKSYWKEFSIPTNSFNPDILYLMPGGSYSYEHPEGTGHDIPPFYSAWFIGGMGDKGR